jgi:hypothetical protein
MIIKNWVEKTFRCCELFENPHSNVDHLFENGSEISAKIFGVISIISKIIMINIILIIVFINILISINLCIKIIKLHQQNVNIKRNIQIL